MDKKTKTIVAASVVGVLLILVIYFNFIAGGPARATAPDEAIKAAEQIAKEQGGGEVPKNEQGVPLDAVIDPKRPPGKHMR
jgi:hypothetical protein